MRSDFISTPSPVESLLNGSTGVWGGLADVNTAQQIADRLELRARFNQPADTGLYQSLNRLLSSGDNDRFILYCPLSLIPAAAQYRQDEAADTFSELYLESWYRLLQVHDVRANFIDGDVPDIELDERPMERVVQAAYLAPILLDKGWISPNQITAIKGEDEVLDKSLDEALDYIPRPQGQPWSILKSASQKRVRWLHWERRRVLTEDMGKVLGVTILAGKVDLDQFDDSDMIVLGIGFAIEQARQVSGKEKASRLYQQHEDRLLRFAQDPDLRDYISRTFCRLQSIGIVGRDKLDELGIFLPSLDGPLYSNLSVVEDERKVIRDRLGTDRELKDLIYPVTIVFGSRLKGYGGPSSDIDLAVFIRPGMQFAADRDLVDRSLESKFGRKVVQYWLERDGNNLCVRDFPKLEANIGGSSDTHVLFGGSWEGESATMLMLCEKLLKPYICSPDLGSRGLWLEEMERDFLQYRLLHRGYERVRVPQAGEVFWDEGYRLTAAKLYSSHVFIPQGG